MDKERVLSDTRSILASYLVHWHRVSVDACLFIGTGSVTIVGFAITRDKLSVALACNFTIILVFLSIFGYFLRKLINGQIIVIRGVIQKVDDELGVFEKGVLKDGGSIYPQSWKVSKDEEWSDPIFRFTLFSVIILPLTLAIMLLIFAFI